MSRDEMILQAAATLFAERGFAGVSVDDIGRTAGVTGPAIYRYYPGKNGTMTAVLERAGRLLLDAVSGSPDMDLESVYARVVAVCFDHPAVLASYVRERTRWRAEFEGRLATVEEALERAWASVVRPRRDDLTDEEITLRCVAALAAIARGTRGRRRVPRPRVDEILAGSAAAMVIGQHDIHPWSEPYEGPWRSPQLKRDVILQAALTMFRAAGYHGVSIDEIGAAAGISGPSVYTYYNSKADLLIDAYDRAFERLVVSADEALFTAVSARDALHRLVRSYVRVAIDHLSLIVVTSQEVEALPMPDRPRVVRRSRSILESWAAPMRELRSDLTETERRVLVLTVFPLMNELVNLIGGSPGHAPVVAGLAMAYVLGDPTAGALVPAETG